MLFSRDDSGWSFELLDKEYKMTIKCTLFILLVHCKSSEAIALCVSTCAVLYTSVNTGEVDHLCH